MMETMVVLKEEPKTDAEYEAEVDRMMLEMQRMLTEMNDPEEQRKYEANRAAIQASLAKLNETLDAIATDNRMAYTYSDNSL